MKVKSLLPWLMVFGAGICLRTGISSLSPVLQQIRAEFGIGSTMLGVLTAIPVICMGALSPLGYALERLMGLKRSVVLAILILTVGLALRLEAGNYYVLLLTAAFVGIGDAIIRPLLSGFIKETLHDKTHAAMGVYATSMGIGSAAAAYATPILADAAGSQWRVGLAFWAIPGVIAALFWAFWRDQSGKRGGQSAVSKGFVDRFDVIWLTLFFGFQAGTNYAVVAWLPSLYSAAGYNQKAGGAFIALFLVLQTAMSLFFPVVMRVLRMGIRGAVVMMVVPAVIGAISLWWLPSVPWAPALCFAVSTGSLFPIALLLPLEFTASAAEATKLSGMTQSGGYLLGGSIPWVAGVAADTFGTLNGIAGTVLIDVVILLVAACLIRSRYPQTKGAVPA
jgi:CP family cyanate transporter-like MFS transporter